MNENDTIIPLKAFSDFYGPEEGRKHRELLKQADIIRGIDVKTKNDFLVYGRETLERIVKSGVPERVRIVYVGLDQATEELEWLLAAVKVLKGHFDYQPSSEGENGMKGHEDYQPSSEGARGMSAEMVRYKDPETGRIITMPAHELAPGVMLVQMAGVGEVYVHPDPNHCDRLQSSSPRCLQNKWKK